ncbi:hypothetical protein ARMGADRAFT_1036014 [Armillaria gallica]|uniref:Uncharacterized protein n=1 Tax=Armillaria gallica TaxID=47427 RepID=A0A2H3DC51_ARMGA|nr:hypothetical protein ARMGADRAFT_1036014 [Armillaria gallica]
MLCIFPFLLHCLLFKMSQGFTIGLCLEPFKILDVFKMFLLEVLDLSIARREMKEAEGYLARKTNLMAIHHECGGGAEARISMGTISKESIRVWLNFLRQPLVYSSQLPMGGSDVAYEVDWRLSGALSKRFSKGKGSTKIHCCDKVLIALLSFGERPDGVKGPDFACIIVGKRVKRLRDS